MKCEKCGQDFEINEFSHPSFNLCAECLKTSSDTSSHSATARHVMSVHVFWRRVFASIIDGLILGAIGLGLGAFASDFFANLGPWGFLVGFSIALVYFGLMDSTITSGQTPGKRLLGVRVVDTEGRTVTAGRAILRYIVIGVPFSLNGFAVPVGIVGSLVLGLIVFGLGLSIPYLLIFNRRTRQGVHDLVAGTYVVYARGEGSVTVPGVWRGHAIFPSVVVLAVLALFAFQFKWTDNAEFKQLIAIQQMVISEADAWNAKVLNGTSHSSGDVSTYLQVIATVKEKPNDDEVQAESIARMIAEQFPDAVNKDALHVTISYGYDIGIARLFFNYNRSWQGAEIQSLK